MGDVLREIDAMRRKVADLFAELAPGCSAKLDGSRFNSETAEAIRNAIAGEFGDEKASDIAFHMTDWNRDAAMVLALLLFPERFTRREIREAVQQFLIHAPDHVAAAAKLAGYPIADTFEVGALDGPDDEP